MHDVHAWPEGGSASPTECLAHDMPVLLTRMYMRALQSYMPWAGYCRERTIIHSMGPIPPRANKHTWHGYRRERTIIHRMRRVPPRANNHTSHAPGTAEREQRVESVQCGTQVPHRPSAHPHPSRHTAICGIAGPVAAAWRRIVNRIACLRVEGGGGGEVEAGAVDN